MLRNKDNVNISDQLRLLNVRFISSVGEESPLKTFGNAFKEGGGRNAGESNASYAARERERIKKQKEERDAQEAKWKEEESAEQRRVKKEQDDEIAKIKVDNAATIKKMEEELQATYDNYVTEQAEERQKQRYYEQYRIKEEDKKIAKEDAEWEKRIVDKATEKKMREEKEKKDEEDARIKKEQDEIKQMQDKAVKQKENMEKGAIGSLENFKPCNVQATDEADKAVESQAVNQVRTESDLVNQGLNPQTGGSKLKKNKVQNEMYLINKRYVDLMGNDDKIVTYNNAGKKNKMKGGFWWFLIQLAIELAQIAIEAAIEAEQDRREDEAEREADELADLEEEFQEANVEYQQNIFEDIEDENEFQTKRAEFAESIKNRPYAEQQELLNELDERRNDATADKAGRKEDLLEQMADEKEDFETTKQDLRDELESTIADMMGNQQSRMDAITAIMVEEEAARKEVRDQRREIANTKRANRKQVLAAEKEERTKERDEKKKEREERKAYENRIRERYQNLEAQRDEEEAKIKGLSGYKGCKSNQEEKESLREKARREIEEEEAKRIQLAAEGKITQDELNNPSGGSRRRRNKMKGGAYFKFFREFFDLPQSLKGRVNRRTEELNKKHTATLKKMAEDLGIYTKHEHNYGIGDIHSSYEFDDGYMDTSKPMPKDMIAWYIACHEFKVGGVPYVHMQYVPADAEPEPAAAAPAAAAEPEAEGEGAEGAEDEEE